MLNEFIKGRLLQLSTRDLIEVVDDAKAALPLIKKAPQRAEMRERIEYARDLIHERLVGGAR